MMLKTMYTPTHFYLSKKSALAKNFLAEVFQKNSFQNAVGQVKYPFALIKMRLINSPQFRLTSRASRDIINTRRQS